MMTNDPHHAHSPIVKVEDDFPDLNSEVYGDRILFEFEDTSCPDNPSGHIYFGRRYDDGECRLFCQYCGERLEP